VKILILTLLLSSCASNSAEYKLEPIANKDMIWRFCDERDNYADKAHAYSGKLCFWHKECKKSFFKKSCRRVLWVVDPANKDRMQSLEIYQKRIR
jgi:hypothetical protein